MIKRLFQSIDKIIITALTLNLFSINLALAFNNQPASFVSDQNNSLSSAQHTWNNINQARPTENTPTKTLQESSPASNNLIALPGYLLIENRTLTQSDNSNSSVSLPDVLGTTNSSTAVSQDTTDSLSNTNNPHSSVEALKTFGIEINLINFEIDESTYSKSDYQGFDLVVSDTSGKILVKRACQSPSDDLKSVCVFSFKVSSNSKIDRIGIVPRGFVEASFSQVKIKITDGDESIITQELNADLKLIKTDEIELPIGIFLKDYE